MTSSDGGTTNFTIQVDCATHKFHSPALLSWNGNGKKDEKPQPKWDDQVMVEMTEDEETIFTKHLGIEVVEEVENRN